LLSSGRPIAARASRRAARAGVPLRGPL
jgi:hypothetical protein